MSTANIVVDKPIPIFCLGKGAYNIYDVNTITYLRRVYNIGGMLIGTLPQFPQQNVFHGSPLRLMPEEVCILVEKRVAYVVNDSRNHDIGFGLHEIPENVNKSELEKVDSSRELPHEGTKLGLIPAQVMANFRELMRREGLEAARKSANDKQRGHEAWMKKAAISKTYSKQALDQPDMQSTAQDESSSDANDDSSIRQNAKHVLADEELLTPSSSSSSAILTDKLQPFAVTPKSSYPPLALEGDIEHESEISIPQPPAYQLYRYLYNLGYFVSPGLRFGCDYLVYPGDPFRYHSHFLAHGVENLDEEFDLIELVGGGRLGTGVKKSYLIGGPDQSADSGNGEENSNVRAFSIEWAGM